MSHIDYVLLFKQLACQCYGFKFPLVFLLFHIEKAVEPASLQNISCSTGAT
jgi:hypothetical protein